MNDHTAATRGLIARRTLSSPVARRTAACGAILAAGLAASLPASATGPDPCGSGPAIVLASTDAYAPTIDPATFTDVVDNPFLPLAAGSRWVYDVTGDGGEPESNVVEVTNETRVVMGVSAVVVHDVVMAADGAVLEETYDWYAQAADGAVWYFGEDSTNYDDPSAPSSKGSWEAGVDGALPGIIMPAHPEVSDTGYREEYSAGVAEDLAQILSLDGSVTTPAGTYDDIVTTRDWNPLEPDVVEEKIAARGVGTVHEETVCGGSETVDLVEYTTAATSPATSAATT